MSLVTIWNFHSLTDAHLAKSKLESEGITCYLANEHMVSMKIHNIAYKGGMQLQVNTAEYEKAAELMRLMGYPVPVFPKTCPKCGSEKIAHVSSGLNGIKALGAAFRTFFASLNPFSSPKNMHCQNCKARF